MELNAEIVKKALECCASPKQMCKDCPMPEEIKDDCRCMETISRNALALIKELTSQLTKKETEYNELYELTEDLRNENEYLKTTEIGQLQQEYDDLAKSMVEADELIHRITEKKANLTEENERLKDTISRLGKNNDELARVLPLAKKEVEVETRADTVREMQTRFAMCFGTYTGKDMTPIIEVFRRFDKIAKEMLEGKI